MLHNVRSAPNAGLEPNGVVSIYFKKILIAGCSVRFSPVCVRGNSLAWQVPEWHKIEMNNPLVNCPLLTVNKN